MLRCENPDVEILPMNKPGLELVRRYISILHYVFQSTYLSFSSANFSVLWQSEAFHVLLEIPILCVHCTST